mmetsp:Transcript_4425/g.7903  ORF Transcript_4425/g.7903 Transcript_4425/m.7903 type:complete len:281 (-) Transcript_4425:461-1303(-)|eukprot:CAMPEP_0175087022 /NCGR_PEP_ID=MMETSP0052_2-20121109/29594_1 /TAXON_ID=51329 ORGANISM="Polytomella parva, Strain SAG 63-3" /NCGR_SAMPLE_ID=MMETSP0052_2 /ASSEMBLY_ACC=CAM_ASM_000194 /LENGTH=280 /DNA_ID=CAMNT_0016359311 /DNA_START=39 /DNA_END=881 /DNA_ORIENTATION=+
MDYDAEQEMEVEALQAIFMDDLLEYDEDLPQGWVSMGKTYKIMITPQEEGSYNEEEEYDYVLEFIFAHTPKYPEEAPSIKLRSYNGLSDADLKQLNSVVQNQVVENEGMAMIFNLIQAAKEWMQNKASGNQEEDPEAAAKREAEEIERRRAAARSLGTPVTLESFQAWKATFDTEMALKRAQFLEQQKDDDKSRRLTGRAYFLKQWQTGEEFAGEEEGAEMDEEELISELQRDAAREEEARDGVDEDEAGTENGDGADVVDEDEDIDYEDDDDEGMLDDL